MLECGLGLIGIRQASERLSFVAPKLVRSGPVEPEVLTRAVRALDLTPDAIVASNWVDNGSGWLAIMLRSREQVLALHPNYSSLTGLKVGVFAAFNPLKDGNSAQFEVRAFSAEDVGHEEPVTGSLNAGLAQWLIGSGMMPSGYVVSQGTALRRMGRVYIEQKWISNMGRRDRPNLCHGQADTLSPLTVFPSAIVEKKTLQVLQSCPWPGDIRELQNVIERFEIVCETANPSVNESWLSKQPSEKKSGDARSV